MLDLNDAVDDDVANMSQSCAMLDGECNVLVCLEYRSDSSNS